MIDSTAIVDPNARIAEDVHIGPYTVIQGDVEIGSGTWVGPHTVIRGRTKIGRNNKIYQFASIGEDPQSLDYHGEDTSLEIGDNNIIREYCTLNRGTKNGGGVTKIGNSNLLMAYVHIAHDCIVNDHVIFANNVNLAGHVTIGNYATLGGLVGVHQFCSIGAYSFLSGGSMARQDVLPYVLVAGDPCKTHGLNAIGLKRRGFNEETIKNLRRAYYLIYRRGLTVPQSLEKLGEMEAECPEVRLFMDALASAERGITR